MVTVYEADAEWEPSSSTQKELVANLMENVGTRRVRFSCPGEGGRVPAHKHGAGTNGSHAPRANSPIVEPQAPGSRGEGRWAEASWQKVAGKSGEMAGAGPDPRVTSGFWGCVKCACVAFPCLP